MSDARQKREEYSNGRSRYREKTNNRSGERYQKKRRSHSRSCSRGRSSNSLYSSHRSNRSSRYKSRRHSRSVSRSRSRSRTRRESRSKSRSYSRSCRRSRTPIGSKHSRPSRSKVNNTETHLSNTQYESRSIDSHRSTLSGIEVLPKPNERSNSVEELPLPPKKETDGAYYNLNTEEPIDKEKIHREIEEKLRAALAKEGKVYPPPKAEASHPVFANDGSFIEIFKKMQQAQQQSQQQIQPPITTSKILSTPVEPKSTLTAAYVAATSVGKPAPPPPVVGRRRGGKILKTGIVAKPKAQGEDNADPKDFWSIYLREVNKYKNNACDSDGGTRPLVK